MWAPGLGVLVLFPPGIWSLVCRVLISGSLHLWATCRVGNVMAYGDNSSRSASTSSPQLHSRLFPCQRDLWHRQKCHWRMQKCARHQIHSLVQSPEVKCWWPLLLLLLFSCPFCGCLQTMPPERMYINSYTYMNLCIYINYTYICTYICVKMK